MCWCFRVFFRVSGNLASRMVADVLDSTYKALAICYCPRRNSESTQVCADNKLGDIFEEQAEQIYQKVNRDEAERLLRDCQNGTFVIRPSCLVKSLGTMSVIQDDKIYHLNIRRREDGLIALGKEKPSEKCFRNLNSLINYYVSNYLLLFSEGVTTHTLLLPYRDACLVTRL